MSIKIATIEVTSCWQCPHYNTTYSYCNRHSVQLPKGYSSSTIIEWEKNIAMNGNIPAFCSLPDKK